MRTSRIAQDTARLLEHLANSPPRTRTRTRSVLAASSPTSPSASTATRNSARLAGAEPTQIIGDDAEGSASTSTSSSGLDIEDTPYPLKPTASRKRKRTASAAENGVSSPLTPRRSKRGEASTKSNSADTSPLAAQAEDESVSPSARGFPARPRPQPAREVTDSAGTVTIHAPTLWEKQWSACQRMRSRQLAPVDTMGCDRLFDPSSPERDQRFQTLIALMLSPQTKDQVTAAAMERLKSTLSDRGGFNIKSIIAMDPVELDALINPVGFHNTKTKNIQLAAQILVDKHASDVPKDVKELMSLPGVGPKIAYLCLQAAWGITDGIGVDVHVHRITNRWGWHKTAAPEATRAMLEKWLPKDRWGPVNHMLVGFGQTVCKPVNPDCARCELAEEGVCPSAVLPRGKARSVFVGVEGRSNGNARGAGKVEKAMVKTESTEAVVEK